MKRGLLIGAGVLALAVPSAAQAFTPNDPLLPKQWYAPQDRAFDAFNVLPLLPTVRVAVIQDCPLPFDLAGTIAKAEHLAQKAAATGAKLMTTMLHELERRGGRYGLQTMCEGGGMANATIIERLG